MLLQFVPHYTLKNELDVISRLQQTSLEIGPITCTFKSLVVFYSSLSVELKALSKHLLNPPKLTISRMHGLN